MNKVAAAMAATVFSVVVIRSYAEDAQQPPGDSQPSVNVLGTVNTGYAVPSLRSATRTDTPLKEVPQSVQVIPRRLIEDQQSLSVSEALGNVSGVTVNHNLSTPAFESTKIRGFDAEFLVDGFTQYYNAGDREGLYGLQQIEVLKGPNAVLYGGGSGTPVGGMVNIVSKAPVRGAFGEVGLKLGTQDFGQLFLDVNRPLGENVLVRFVGEGTMSHSSTDVIDQDRYNINPSITFTNNTTTSLTLQAKASRWRQQEYQGLPAAGTVAGDFRIDRDLFIGPADIPRSTADFNGIWATLAHKLNETWALDVRARYATSKFDEKVQTLFGGDGFQGNQPFVPPSLWTLTNAELYQEQKEHSVLANATARFSTGAISHTLLVGGDYSKLDDEGFIDFVGAGVGFVDLASPVFPVPYSDPGPGLSNQFVENTTHGVYAQLQSTISRLHLLMGLRYAHVGIRFHTPTTNAETNEDKLLPRIGAVLDITPHVAVFANYAEGMRGQPFSNFVSTPEPAKSKTIEAGVKLDTQFGLSGQIAVYEIKRTNVAVTDFSDPFFRSVATGKQRSRGIEFDLNWQATRDLSVLASYAYTDAQFVNDVFGVPAGNTLSGVPRNTARLWAHYRFANETLQGLDLGAGVYWQSSTYVNDSNTFEADSYHRFDAAMGYQLGRLKLGLTLKNLSNEKYYEYYDYFGGRIAPGSSRAAILSAAYRF